MTITKAWEIARATPVLRHEPGCSYRMMDGGMLCDCQILNKRIREEEQKSILEE